MRETKNVKENIYKNEEKGEWNEWEKETQERRKEEQGFIPPLWSTREGEHGLVVPRHSHALYALYHVIDQVMDYWIRWESVDWPRAAKTHSYRQYYYTSS